MGGLSPGGGEGVLLLCGLNGVVVLAVFDPTWCKVCLPLK